MSITVDNQMSYMLQWFHEWSELQRSDFLPIVIENYGNKTYVNGIVNNISNVNFQDKPMSLFQCRVKLFKEWIPQWGIDHKADFLRRLGELDPGFGDKVQAELQNGVPHSETNGIASEEILED